MASTSVTFDAEVYAYSKSQGLFAGVSLEGNGIFIWKKANKRFYGDSSAATILASKEALDQDMILGTPLIIAHSERPQPARP